MPQTKNIRLRTNANGKEANNDAGLAAHPSGRFDVNRNHFQLVMLAYNLNCWLMLFNREAQPDVAALQHTTLATTGEIKVTRVLLPRS